MMIRTLVAFVATAGLSAALACGGTPCGGCAAAAETAAATNIAEVDGEMVVFNVSGVHCGGTAAAFHAAVTGIDGVKGAKVTPDGRAEVKFDAKATSVDKIIEAVAKTERFAAKRAEA